MAFVLPSFNLADIITFVRVVKVRTANGAELPFVCTGNDTTATWQAPQHPTDSNVVISDTIYKNPIEINLQGHVPAKSLDRFIQLINGSTEQQSSYKDNVLNNIFGRSPDIATPTAAPLGLYTVTLLGNTHENMALMSFSRTETPEENSGYAVTLNFKQVMIVEDDYTKLTKEQVAQAQAADTIDSGKVAPRNSLLYEATQKVQEKVQGFIGR